MTVSDDHHLPPQPEHYAFPLCLAHLLAWALSVYAYTGFYASDDMTYLGSIVAVAKGQQLSPSLASLRFPVVYQGALFYWFFDKSIFAAILSFTLYAPLVTFLTFRIGTGCFCRAVGVSAAYIVACSPLVYLYAGALLPDLMLTAVTCTWFLSLTKALRAIEDNCLRARRWLGWLLVTATLNGLAYWVKESGLILLIPAALVTGSALWRHASLRRLPHAACVYLLGLAVILAAEALSIRYKTGEWVYRLGVVQIDAGVLLDLYNKQGTDPMSRFLYAGHLLRSIIGGWPMYFTLCGAVAFPILAWRRGLTLSSLALWATGVWIVLYLTVGSTSLGAYVPPAIVHRYYVMALPFLGVLTGAAIVGVCQGACLRTRISARVAKRSAMLLVVAVCLCSLGSTLKRNKALLGRIYRSGEVHAFLRAYDYGRTHMPEQMIVFSAYTVNRMWPLYTEGCPSGTYFGIERPASHPCQSVTALKESFLLIAPETRYYEKAPKDFVRDLLGHGQFSLETIRTFYAPASRWDELASNNWIYMNRPYSQPMQEAKNGKGYAIHRITVR